MGAEEHGDVWRLLALATNQLVQLRALEDTRVSICRGALWLTRARAVRLYEHVDGVAVPTAGAGALGDAELALERRLLDLRSQRDGVAGTLEMPASGGNHGHVQPLRYGETLFGELAVHTEEESLPHDVFEALRYFADTSGAALSACHDRALLHRETHTDALTGLANLRALEQLLETLPDGTASALVVDFDGLGRINRELGVEAGNEVIRSVAGILARAASPEETVARTGGDEFVVVLPDADSDGACARALEVRDVLDELILPGPLGLHFRGASVGWASPVAPEEPNEDVIKRANAAMQAVKRRRRDDA